MNDSPEEFMQEETAVGAPELSKREQLGRLLRMKTHFVHRKVVELDVFKNMREVEKIIRFRIEQEEKGNVKTPVR